jgi:hypothetical protein
LTSRTEAAVHAELSQQRVRAADGTVPETLTALLGLDFAF